jgi:hypothetical protein
MFRKNPLSPSSESKKKPNKQPISTRLHCVIFQNTALVNKVADQFNMQSDQREQADERNLWLISELCGDLIYLTLKMISTCFTNTDFMLWRRLTVDIDSVLGWLDRADAGKTASVSEIHAPSFFSHCFFSKQTYRYTLRTNSVLMTKAVCTSETSEHCPHPHGALIATCRGRGGVVGIAIGYGLDDREVGVRVLVGPRIFSFPRRPDLLWGPPNLLSNWYHGIFPEGKAAGAWNWLLTSS